jgi:nitrile hydratase
MSERHPHTHQSPPQPDHPEPSSDYELLGVALNELLIEKRIYTAAEMRATIEQIESIDSSHGARVVARAWTDPDYKAELLADGFAAVEKLGLDPGYVELTVLENTPQVHNVVVCTLCSCYPRLMLGRPPVWYKSKAYRSRVVREPRAVLREFGTEIPKDVEVRVHDSTAELRYLVLPMRPANTDGLSEDELVELVTRDSMIGTALAEAPSVAS